MSGQHRIVAGEVAQSKARGNDLKKALGRMNEFVTTPSAPKVVKTKAKKK